MNTLSPINHEIYSINWGKGSSTTLMHEQNIKAFKGHTPTEREKEGSQFMALQVMWAVVITYFLSNDVSVNSPLTLWCFHSATQTQSTSIISTSIPDSTHVSTHPTRLPHLPPSRHDPENRQQRADNCDFSLSPQHTEGGDMCLCISIFILPIMMFLRLTKIYLFRFYKLVT